MNFKKIWKNYWPIILISIISLFIFTFRLGREVLWDWDECLYGQYAKEMKSTGHYLTNIWNGYKDFQKPPLYTWLLFIPTFFIQNEFSIRILSVIFSTGILVTIYLFTKKYFSARIAILTALLLLTSEVFVVYTIRANTDMGYTLLILLGVWSWIVSFKKSKFSYLAGFLFGLSVMIKGLGTLQILAALFITIFLNPTKGKFINFFKLGAIFALTIIPWHLSAYLTYSQQFIQVYFWENIVKRANNPIEFHFEGRSFYAKLLFKELFPWILFSLVLPITYLFRIRKFFKVKNILIEFKRNEILFIVILLIMIPLALLTKIQTRIAWYALPLYPFVAIYLAYNIDLLLKKLKLAAPFYLILILLILDSGRLLINETRLFKSQRDIPPKYEAAIEVKKQSEKELNYLVPFGERRGREVLDPKLTIPQTWIFGGNPCAVYYSDKKVNYYYFVNDFMKRLKKDGLFLVENGDLHFIEKVKTKTLFQNKEFTLFKVRK